MSKGHPLKCPRCPEYLYLIFKGTRFQRGTKTVAYKIPFYECITCRYSTPYKPQEYWEKLADEDSKSLNEGEFTTMSFKYEDKEFPQYKHLQFKYDSADYYLIPGLRRPDDDGYLTPVFFDKDLLLYYNNHPDYIVVLSSFSSGNIYYKGQRLFRWGFGLTRSGKIFKWLGDLEEDFRDEAMASHLKRFQASNVDSDHDIISHFYFSQNPFSPADAFQKSDNEYEIFDLRNKFENNILQTFNIKLSKLNIEHIANEYKHPILDEIKQIFSAYMSLDQYLIENIDQNALKKILLENGVTAKEIQGLRSIKLLELFISKVLKIPDADSIISPLYVLNDLRQLHGHLSNSSFQGKYDSCKKRLAVSSEMSDLDLFKVVVESLIGFYKKLNQETKLD